MAASAAVVGIGRLVYASIIAAQHLSGRAGGGTDAAGAGAARALRGGCACAADRCKPATAIDAGSAAGAGGSAGAAVRRIGGRWGAESDAGRARGDPVGVAGLPPFVIVVENTHLRRSCSRERPLA